MPSDYATLDRPPHPLAEMTTSELSRYKVSLERAIKRLTVEASAELRSRLADVLAEEEDREHIRLGLAANA
jgi:hypothetical protein